MFADSLKHFLLSNTTFISVFHTLQSSWWASGDNSSKLNWMCQNKRYKTCLVDCGPGRKVLHQECHHHRQRRRKWFRHCFVLWWYFVDPWERRKIFHKDTQTKASFYWENLFHGRMQLLLMSPLWFLETQPPVSFSDETLRDIKIMVGNEFSEHVTNVSDIMGWNLCKYLSGMFLIFVIVFVHECLCTLCQDWRGLNHSFSRSAHVKLNYSFEFLTLLLFR